MKIEKISNQGLKNDFLVTFPANTVTSAVESYIAEKAKVVRMDGFRPGKVPAHMIRQRFGEEAHKETIDDLLNKAYKNIINENKLRPATSPNVNLKSKDLGEDLVFEVSVETLPEIKIGDFKKIKLNRFETEVSDKEMEDAIQEILGQSHRLEDVKRKAKKEDIANVDITTTFDGKAVPSLTANDINLFASKDKESPLSAVQDALIGKGAGEEFDVEQVFDKDFSEKTVAGKTVQIHVMVKSIKEKKSVEKIDEQFLKDQKMESEDQFRDQVKKGLENQHDQMTRLIVKRELLDVLDKDYQFDIPQSLLDQEFQNIWGRLEAEIEEAKARGDKDIETLDDASKDEYKILASRRVRLGLLIGEISKEHKIAVSEDQVKQLIFQEAMKYPGQEKQVLDYIRSHPQMIEQIKAPALEDMVIDFIVERATLNNKSVALDELKAKFEEIVPSNEETAEKKPKKSAAKKKSKEASE